MLFGSAFQLGYVTTDLTRACEAMREQYGVAQFLRSDGLELPTDRGVMKLNLANAWVGPTWIEIIEPLGGAVALYRDWMEADTVLRFHHVGIRLPDRAACARIREEAAASGKPLVLDVESESAQAFYIDTVAGLGHYLEYIMFEGDSPIMKAMPQNLAG